MGDEFKHVASLSDLRDAQAQCVVMGNGQEVLLVCIDYTAVYAVQPTYTYQGTWLDIGTVLSRSLKIESPLHVGRFDLRTGAPTNPPLTVPIKTYAKQIQDGSVFVAPAIETRART